METDIFGFGLGRRCREMARWRKVRVLPFIKCANVLGLSGRDERFVARQYEKTKITYQSPPATYHKPFTIYHLTLIGYQLLLMM